MTIIYAAPDVLGVPDDGIFGNAANTGEIDSPLTVAAAIARNTYHIELKAGTYHGDESMVDIEDRDTFKFTGTDVLIDGEMDRKPFRVVNCHNYEFDIEWNCCNVGVGSEAVCTISGCTNGKIIGLGGWMDAPAIYTDQDMKAIGVGLCIDMEFGWCFGFGYARKAIELFRSIRVRVHHSWFRWDDWGSEDGNRMAIAPYYRSYDNIVEDCMATCAGSFDPLITDPGHADRYGALIGDDAWDTIGGTPVDVWERLNDPTRDRWDTRIIIRRCMLYRFNPTRRIAGTQLRMTADPVPGQYHEGNIVEDLSFHIEDHPGQNFTINGRGQGTVDNVFQTVETDLTHTFDAAWDPLGNMVDAGLNTYGYYPRFPVAFLQRITDAVATTVWDAPRFPDFRRQLPPMLGRFYKLKQVSL